LVGEKGGVSVSRSIADIMGKNYRNEIDFDETVRILARDWHKHELAYFIVDAKSRGWITNFNLGLDDEGYRI